jgi:hypothetical protein
MAEEVGVVTEVAKLRQIRQLGLPADLFTSVSPKLLTHYQQRVEELSRRWPMTSLLDILKETDLRVGFTSHFRSVSSRETLDRATLQRRLLLCLYGLGTNAGLKRLSTSNSQDTYADLLYVRRRYIHSAQLRTALAQVVNAIFRVRLPHIWGEGTTATCTLATQPGFLLDSKVISVVSVLIRLSGRGQ